MATKNYICTGLGFVKGKHHDKSNNETVIEYTDKVREAFGFKTEAAMKWIEKYDIKGFIWKPYAQEPVREKYEVRKTHTYGFMCDTEEEEKNIVEYWKPSRMTMLHDSDVSFLFNKGKLDSEKGMSYEEARAESIRLNTEIVDKMKIRIDKIANDEKY